jgi:hypothetical protein
MLSIKRTLISCGIVFLSVLALSQPTKADSVTITNGFVDVTSNIRDILSFNFSGNGFSVNGLDSHAPIQQYMSPCLSSASRCQPGDLIFPNALVPLSAEGPSSVTFNSTTVLVSWGSHDSFLQFTGAGAIIPAGTDQVTLTIPFDMTGTINVHAANDPAPVIFSTMINGSGLATLTLTRPAGNPVGFAITRARYDFSPAAVPEPATVILLTTGIMGFGANRWRRVRRSKKH